MGNSNYRQENSQINLSEWAIVSTSKQYKTWKNIQSGVSVEEYEFLVSDQSTLEKYRQIYQWRKTNAQNLVTAFDFKTQNKNEMCSTFYKGSIFLEAIVFTLEMINQIPFPDTMHLYGQCFRGFAELYEKIGYFDINENLICVNRVGIVKTWWNKDRSAVSPQASYLNIKREDQEREMTRRVIQILNANIDHSSHPENITNYLYQNRSDTFFNACLNIDKYAERYGVAGIRFMKCTNQIPEKYIDQLKQGKSEFITSQNSHHSNVFPSTMQNNQTVYTNVPTNFSNIPTIVQNTQSRNPIFSNQPIVSNQPIISNQPILTNTNAFQNQYQNRQPIIYGNTIQGTLQKQLSNTQLSQLKNIQPIVQNNSKVQSPINTYNPPSNAFQLPINSPMVIRNTQPLMVNQQMSFDRSYNNPQTRIQNRLSGPTVTNQFVNRPPPQAITSNITVQRTLPQQPTTQQTIVTSPNNIQNSTPINNISKTQSITIKPDPNNNQVSKVDLKTEIPQVQSYTKPSYQSIEQPKSFQHSTNWQKRNSIVQKVNDLNSNDTYKNPFLPEQQKTTVQYDTTHSDEYMSPEIKELLRKYGGGTQSHQDTKYTPEIKYQWQSTEKYSPKKYQFEKLSDVAIMKESTYQQLSSPHQQYKSLDNYNLDKKQYSYSVGQQYKPQFESDLLKDLQQLRQIK